ncbi:MAG: ATP-binding protein [Treponema sp.]|nr:ATP-binding protein [Treponema sp.]
MTGILKKSFAIIALAVLIIAAYFITGVLRISGAQYNEINTENLKETVITLGNLTPVSVFTEEGAAEDWSSRVGNSVPCRITLIGRNGQVIFDTNADSAEMEDHLARPEFQAAIITGTGTARRQSATLGQEYIYAALAVKDSSGETAGILRISRQVPNFFSRLLKFTFPFLSAGFLIILSVCAGLYFFSRRLSYSIQVKQKAELEEKTRELKTKAKEAGEESQRLQAILNGMSEGVIALDSNLKITMINPKACSLFGFDAGDDEKDIFLGGISLLEFSRSDELEDAARRVLSSDNTFELVIKRYISGAEQHYRVFVTPLIKSRGIIIVLEDISRLVKLEQIRKDFAANVSHELRTPIQVVKGFSETILDSPPEDREEILRYVEIIRKNAQTMENLTNDLLTLVSLEDGSNSRPPMEETALKPLIVEAVCMVEIATRKKNISVEVFCSPDLFAKLHSSFIIQALVNLLDNGIKYSGSDSRIKINAFREEGMLVIEVKDKGIGIPAEHLGRLFERFYRVDRSRSREAGGTGLGLAIVRHIAFLHNGTAEVESHAGEGSTFRLRLPC